MILATSDIIPTVSTPGRVPDNEDILNDLSRQKCLELLPSHVYVAVVALFGVLGNVFVCVFYSRPERVSYSRPEQQVLPTNRLIVALAVVDVCFCVHMPKHIVIMCRSYRGYGSTLCPLSVCLDTFSVVSAGFILLAIASLRFQAVYRVSPSPVTLRHTNLIIAACLAIAAGIAVPTSLTFESVQLNVTVDSNRSIVGHSCLLSKDPEKGAFVFASSMTLDTLFFFVLILYVVLYCLIGKKLFKHFTRKSKRLQNPTQRFNNPDSCPSPSPSSRLHSQSPLKGMPTGNSIDETTDTDNDKLHNNDSNVGEGESAGLAKEEGYNIQRQNGDLLSKSPKGLNPNQNTRTKTARNNTNVISDNGVTRRVFMCFSIVMVFVISLLPYIAISVADDVLHIGEANNLYTNWKQLGLKSYILHSALNPVIYAAFNPAFRHFVWRRVCHCQT